MPKCPILHPCNLLAIVAAVLARCLSSWSRFFSSDLIFSMSIRNSRFWMLCSRAGVSASGIIRNYYMNYFWQSTMGSEQHICLHSCGHCVQLSTSLWRRPLSYNLCVHHLPIYSGGTCDINLHTTQSGPSQSWRYAAIIPYISLICERFTCNWCAIYLLNQRLGSSIIAVRVL